MFLLGMFLTNTQDNNDIKLQTILSNMNSLFYVGVQFDGHCMLKVQFSVYLYDTPEYMVILIILLSFLVKLNMVTEQHIASKLFISCFFLSF